MNDADNRPAVVGQVERPVRPGAEAHKLTDSQIADVAFAVLRAHNDDRLWRALTYNSGPYEVTMPTVALCHLARVFFGAGVSAALVSATQPVYCWLVELFEGDGSGNSAGWYHTGFVDIGGHSRTTKNPHEARRYATRERAEQTAKTLGTTLTGTWRAVEHGF